jgi:hypothetical protein
MGTQGKLRERAQHDRPEGSIRAGFFVIRVRLQHCVEVGHSTGEVLPPLLQQPQVEHSLWPRWGIVRGGACPDPGLLRSWKVTRFIERIPGTAGGAAPAALAD